MLLRLRAWLRALFRRGTVEREMREEMQLHLDRATERLIARGLSADVARLQARREFGNLGWLQEEARDARGVRWAEELEQDFRIALRRLRHAPGLATAIVLTVGLGLGAAAAIFTAAEAAFIKPLPYAHAERLVQLSEAKVGSNERSATSYPTLEAWRARLGSFSALEGYDPSNFVVNIGTETRMLRGAEVTTGFFQLLGVHPSVGRTFANDDGNEGSADVAIISARLARPIGTVTVSQSININGRPHLVVGVLPADFQFAVLQDADVFVPLLLDARRRADQSNRSIHVVGRLGARTTLGATRAELASVMARLANEQPEVLGGRTAIAIPLREALLGNVRPILTNLLLAVTLVLVTLAANLALLMLARYAERLPELHMRSVLGATRARILRHLFAESLVPGLLGAALAVAIGHVGTRALLNVIPESVRIGMPYLANADIDAKIVVSLTALTLVLVMLFGVLPGVVEMRERPPSHHGRATLSQGDRRVRRGLVAVQLALTVVLLVCTGLLVRSFANLLHRDLGFADPASLVVASAPLTGPRYDDPGRQRQFYEELLNRSLALAGVRAAALVNEGPGGGSGMATFDPTDRPQPLSLQSHALVRIIGGAYFATMRIPLLEGRAFDSRDRVGSPPVVVVSASLAKLLAQSGGVIGRRLRLSSGDSTSWEVVGVAGDVQATALDAAPSPVIYATHQQMAEHHMMLVLRTELSVESVRQQVRSIVGSLDANVPVYGVARVDQQLDDSWAVLSRRFPMILCAAFGVAALALALVAMYAICAHEVTMRRRELGIRLALGARPRVIQVLIVKNGLRVALIGIVSGVLVAFALARSIQTLLFGVTAADWKVYGVAAAVVLVSCLAATIGPALRARSTDLSIVMRQE